MYTDKKNTVRDGPFRRISMALAKFFALFIILEPIWMLLPFAGFLYGSVLHIQSLNRNPCTAWLTHFVFPVLTFGWMGPILIVIGFMLFLVGAGQIYWAKIRRSGLVTKGLYRFVRHPQYISLTLFGAGILLTWGRAITFIAFFIMMFLYYYLTKSEERTCIRIFGDEYRRYSNHTSFIIPGDTWLRPLGAKMPSMNLPSFVRPIVVFTVMLALCFSLMWLIQTVKDGLQTVPYMVARIHLGNSQKGMTREGITMGESQGIPFVTADRIVVIRGPYRNARAPGFAERILLRLRESRTLAHFLSFVDEPGEDMAIVWCGPYERPNTMIGQGPKGGSADEDHGSLSDPHGTDRVRLILMRCRPSKGATIADLLADKSKREIIYSCIALVNLARSEGEDIVEGDGCIRGYRFPGEERWDYFMKQFAQTSTFSREEGSGSFTQNQFENARLVLVQAPILRTRIDHDFAHEILNRLVESQTFRSCLSTVGAGGDTIAVAFPRPGPNWYQKHHDKPQINIFVILARLVNGENAPLQDLFNTNNRHLLSAFIAPMDFSITSSTDSVSKIKMIGPRRNLEERWRFFLSGLGATVIPHNH